MKTSTIVIIVISLVVLGVATYFIVKHFMQPKVKNCVLKNGTCNIGIIKDSKPPKRACIGGDLLCGMDIDAHNSAHNSSLVCGNPNFNKFVADHNMATCNSGYKIGSEKNQNNCQIKCVPN